MRYAGPRMIYSHPIKSFRHLFKKLKKIDELKYSFIDDCFKSGDILIHLLN